MVAFRLPSATANDFRPPLHSNSTTKWPAHYIGHKSVRGQGWVTPRKPRSILCTACRWSRECFPKTALTSQCPSSVPEDNRAGQRRGRRRRRRGQRGRPGHSGQRGERRLIHRIRHCGEPWKLLAILALSFFPPQKIISNICIFFLSSELGAEPMTQLNCIAF